MGRPRTKGRKTVHFTADYAADLITAFGNLAEQNGVSMKEALRRCMINAVNLGEVPGIEHMDLVTRENEKFGEAVPVFDGNEKRAEKPSNQRVTPVAPAE